MSERKLPFVWELKKDGVVSHAIGTAHLVPNVYQDDARAYLSRTKKLFLEINPTKMDSPLFGELQAGEFDELCHALALSPERIKALPPTDRLAYGLYKEGYTRYKAVDIALYEAALALNTPVGGLELSAESKTTQKILNFPDISRKLLETERANPGSARTMLEGIKFLLEIMMESYQTGSLGFISTITEKTANPRFMDDLVQRNRKMVERSIRELEQPSIVAVGLNHLVREPSMLTMYQEKGIEVKRVQ